MESGLPNLRVLDLSWNSLTSFQQVYQAVAQSGLLHTLAYKDNPLRHCSSRVLDFYEFVLESKLPALGLLNGQGCRNRGYNRAQFRKLYRHRACAIPRDGSEALFDLLASEAELVLSLPADDPLLRSACLAQHEQQSLASLPQRLALAQPWTVLPPSLFYKQQELNIRQGQALAKISRLLFGLRRRLARRREYFGEMGGQVQECLAFLGRWTQASRGRFVFGRFWEAAREGIAVRKIERMYINFSNRKKYRQLRDKLKGVTA